MGWTMDGAGVLGRITKEGWMANSLLVFGAFGGCWWNIMSAFVAADSTMNTQFVSTFAESSVLCFVVLTAFVW